MRGVRATRRKEKMNMVKTYSPLILVVLAYGVYYPVISFLLGTLSPLAIGAYRLLIASVLFALMLTFTSSWKRVPKQLFLHLLCLAVAGYYLNAVIYNFGLKFCDAVTGALVFSLSPLLSAVFARIILKEDFSGWKIAGSVIALTGVFLVVGRGTGVNFSLGLLILFIGAAGYGLAMISAKYLVEVLGFLAATAYATFIAAALASVTLLLSPSPVFTHLPLFETVLLLASSLILVSNLIWNRAIPIVGVVKTTVLNNISPVVTMVTSAVFLGDEILPIQIGGALLILAGVSSVVLAKGKAASPLETVEAAAAEISAVPEIPVVLAEEAGYRQKGF